MSPGLRVGFVTGAKHLIERIELHIQAASLHASALSQVNESNRKLINYPVIKRQVLKLKSDNKLISGHY